MRRVAEVLRLMREALAKTVHNAGEGASRPARTIGGELKNSGYDGADLEAQKAFRGGVIAVPTDSGMEYASVDHYPLPSGLGDEADELISSSPSMRRRLYQVQRLDWMVSPTAQGFSSIDEGSKIILVDDSLSAPRQVGEAAHLIGHIHPDNADLWEIGTRAERAEVDPTAADPRENYARWHSQMNLEGEAVSQLQREQARAEILEATGSDIGSDSDRAAAAFENYQREREEAGPDAKGISDWDPHEIHVLSRHIAELDHTPHTDPRTHSGTQNFGDALMDYYRLHWDTSTE